MFKILTDAMNSIYNLNNTFNNMIKKKKSKKDLTFI